MNWRDCDQGPPYLNAVLLPTQISQKQNSLNSNETRPIRYLNCTFSQSCFRSYYTLLHNSLSHYFNILSPSIKKNELHFDLHFFSLVIKLILNPCKLFASTRKNLQKTVKIFETRAKKLSEFRKCYWKENFKTLLTMNCEKRWIESLFATPYQPKTVTEMRSFLGIKKRQTPRRACFLLDSILTKV